jgi:hypothetical protein
MAIDRRIGNRVSEFVRREDTPGVRLDSGPFLAVVKNTVDASRLGRIQVYIPELGAGGSGTGADDSPSNWRTVSYASPFFGETYQSPSAPSPKNTFDATRHTYGWWMTPPDIGTKVLVLFVNGDPGRGYYFACVPTGLSQHMLPGLAGSGDIQSADQRRDQLGDSDFAPVAEFNENDDKLSRDPKFLQNKKPLHDVQTRIYKNQGLLQDQQRGPITSSSQRESPSFVYGFSTPGRPLDDQATNDILEPSGADVDASKLSPLVPSRKGGHSFVLDDGDAAGESRIVRLRSAAGHQILLNDTEGFVHVINASGTGWVEITKTGEIMIYSQGGVNLRTQGDLNLHSDKDVNIFAGKNLNLAAEAGIQLDASSNIVTHAGGKNIVFAKSQVEILGNSGVKIESKGSASFSASGTLDFTGSYIGLNSGAAASVSAPRSIPRNQLADTTRNEQGFWTSQPGKLTTILSSAPSHEPFNRNLVVAPSTGNVTIGDATTPQVSDPKDQQSLAAMPSDWPYDTAFLAKVDALAGKLGSNRLDLLSCMHFETGGTMSPSIQNKTSRATGLIQFIPTVARELGTTVEDLAKMTRAQQMEYVDKYMTKWLKTAFKVSNPTLEDMYMTILWPRAVGKPNSYVLFSRGSAAYTQNPLDLDRDGDVTKAEAASKVAARKPLVEKALARARANPIVTTGSGGTLTDSQGNPVRTER